VEKAGGERPTEAVELFRKYCCDGGNLLIFTIGRALIKSALHKLPAGTRSRKKLSATVESRLGSPKAFDGDISWRQSASTSS
jgi:hypothetical protein